MPHELEQAGLLLLRTTKITDEEWLRLVDARKELICSDIESFALHKLGDATYSYGGIRMRLARGVVEFKSDNPHITLDHRGLFWEDIGRPKQVCEGDDLVYRHKIFGLSLKGEWVVTVFKVKTPPFHPNIADEPEVRVEAISLVTTLRLLNVITIKAPDLFLKLGEVIRVHARRRQALADAANRLKEIVDWEDAMLRDLTRFSKVVA